MKKVVIDTGVVVSALLKNEGTSRKALTHGDPDLLSLNPFHNIPVLTPADFIDWLAESKV